MQLAEGGGMRWRHVNGALKIECCANLLPGTIPLTPIIVALWNALINAPNEIDTAVISSYSFVFASYELTSAKAISSNMLTDVAVRYLKKRNESSFMRIIE